MISKIEVERFSLTSFRPFDEVLASINGAVGHPDMVEFAKTTAATTTFTELESTIRKGLGKTGLMLFMELDHGAVILSWTRSVREDYLCLACIMHEALRSPKAAMESGG